MSGMIKDLKKFNRLSRVANSTLAANGPGNYRFSAASTEHLRYELINEKTMKIHYQGSFAVASKSMMSSIMFKLVQDAVNAMKRSMETFAREYKEQFDSNVTLKLDEKTIIDNVEFSSYSVFKPTQSGILRVTALIDVSGGDDVENYFDKVEKKNEMYRSVEAAKDTKKKVTSNKK